MTRPGHGLGHRQGLSHRQGLGQGHIITTNTAASGSASALRAEGGEQLVYLLLMMSDGVAALSLYLFDYAMIFQHCSIDFITLESFLFSPTFYLSTDPSIILHLLLLVSSSRG